MERSWRSAFALGLSAVLTSCAGAPNARFALKKIPVEIERGKPIKFDFRLSGENKVALECGPELWRALTSTTQTATATLVSSNRGEARIGGLFSGADHTVWGLASWHYLFYVDGRFHAKVSVQLSFPNAPPGVARANIIIAKTPSDFGP
jgi:hypothetical protein